MRKSPLSAARVDMRIKESIQLAMIQNFPLFGTERAIEATDSTARHSRNQKSNRRAAESAEKKDTDRRLP